MSPCPSSRALTEPRTYELAPLWPRPPLRANGTQLHWRRRATVVRAIRTLVAARAREQGMHLLTGIRHLTIQLCYAPAHHRDMDAPNFYPTLKPCVDALSNPRRTINPHSGATPWIGLTLVPKDTSEYVTLLETEIHRPPVPGPRCWLIVTVHP